MKMLVAIVAATLLIAAAGFWLYTQRGPSARAAALTAEGIRLQEAGDRDGAAARYEAALAADDDAREARSRLAMLRFKQSRYAEAVPIMQRAVEENPDDSEMVIDLGTALLQLDRNAEGIAYLEHAIEIAPDSPAAHNNLGVAYAQQERYAEAAAQFERTLQIKPDHRSAGRSLDLVRQQIPK